MKTNKMNQITEGPLFKALFLYFLPIFMGSLVQQSYNFVDAIIIGRYAGAGALAAIDATYSYIKLLINVFIAMALGGTIIVSQYYGANAYKKVSEVVHTLIPFAIVGGLVMTLIGIVMTPTFTAIMNVPKDIYSASVTYLRIYFLGTVFSFVYNIGAGVLRAVGDTKRPFYFLLASSLLNIVLDYLFIAHFGMGVAGAALGTVLSQLLSGGLALYALVKSNDAYKLVLRKMRLHWSTLKQIIKIGLPMGGQSALYSVANMYMQRGINSFGTLGIAGWAICGKMDLIIWLVIETLGITVTTFVAQNFGAKKKKRMQCSIGYGFLFSAVVVGILSAILFSSAHIIASWFTTDLAVIEISKQMMRLVAPFYLIYIIGEILSGAIKGQGETFMPMVLTLVGTCALRVGWVLIVLPKEPRVLTAITGYPVSWIATAILFIVYYIVFNKKNSTTEQWFLLATKNDGETV